MRSVIILGSTGSIGVQALNLAKKFKIKVEALSCSKNIELLASQIAEFSPKFVCVGSKQFAKNLLDILKVIESKSNKKLKIPRIFYEKNENLQNRFNENYKNAKSFANSGLCELLNAAKSNVVLNAIVGFAGLAPTLFAQKLGKKIALANKESLVCGGALVARDLLFPVDSEHFAASFLLNFPKTRKFSKLFITASGGAFRDMALNQIPHQFANAALKHPNWQMGAKITIDSASMANKLFEILEALWLFAPPKNIKTNIKKYIKTIKYNDKNNIESMPEISAFIERNSHIHALVEFADGSIAAHFATADMALPIFSAFCKFGLIESKKDSIKNNIIKPLNLLDFNYHLEEIKEQRYPLWALKNELLARPNLGVVLNAANEVAVAAFLENKINFGILCSVVLDSVEKFSHNIKFNDFISLCELDFEVRKFTETLIKE